MASRICSLVIGLDFGMLFFLTKRPPRSQKNQALERDSGSWRARLEASGLGVEAGDLHDQRVIRIAGLDDPRIGLRILGGQDDDVDTALTMLDRPLQVRDPLAADPARCPLQRWSESRVIGKVIVLADDLVRPHRHDDGLSVVADRRSSKVPKWPSRAEMLKRSRERPICLHGRCRANRWSAGKDAPKDSKTAGSPCRLSCLNRSWGLKTWAQPSHWLIVHTITYVCMLFNRERMHKNCAT